jgi:uncharacterized protein (DUF1697 family)
MPTYVSFLRGINLGSHNRIAMPALTNLYQDQGFTAVQTYLQSGNVVFDAPEEDADALEIRFSEAIRTTWGLEVPVLLRTREAVTTMLIVNPYAARAEAAPTACHITLLSSAPLPAQAEALALVSSAPDECTLLGREVYLYCPGGYGNTKFSNAFIERKLKVTATTRNLNTMRAMLTLAE